MFGTKQLKQIDHMLMVVQVNLRELEDEVNAARQSTADDISQLKSDIAALREEVEALKEPLIQATLDGQAPTSWFSKWRIVNA